MPENRTDISVSAGRKHNKRTRQLRFPDPEGFLKGDTGIGAAQLSQKEVKEMSNRLFQGIVHQMKDAVNRVIGVIDENGTIIACSDLTRVGGGNDFFPIELGDSHEVFIRLSLIHI